MSSPLVIHSSAFFLPVLNPGILPICRSNAADRLNPLMCVREPISQGQALARLNAREAQQRVNERQTAATLAQRQFDRFQTLAGRQAISKAEMDIQRANRDSANAALKIAREELSQMTLTAPFSGIAASVPIVITRLSPPDSRSSP
jgi:multidrug resistance efflux pump